MSKKNFKTSFDDLLSENTRSSKSHNKIQEIRSTFIVNVNNIEKLKAVAFWEKKLIKNVLDEALNEYFERYTQARGPIQLPK
jgi:hypothetical protein